MKLKYLLVSSLKKAHSGAYCDYIRKHGMHFTESLADYAGSLMYGKDGSKAKWTVQEIVAAAAKFEIAEENIGDFAYLANMYYTDFVPDILTEAQCLKAAEKLLQDPDGYDGMAFARWMADIKHKDIEVDWEKFI